MQLPGRAGIHWTQDIWYDNFARIFQESIALETFDMTVYCTTLSGRAGHWIRYTRILTCNFILECSNSIILHDASSASEWSFHTGTITTRPSFVDVDIRDIVLTRGNLAPASLSGLERVPVFTFRSRDTLQQFRVDDVKQKISVFIWEQLQLDIRTSDFVILFNPSLATQHRWSPGLLKLSCNLTWYQVLYQLDLPIHTPTMMLETCTTPQWQWIQDRRLLASSNPELFSDCTPRWQKDHAL